MHTNNTRPQATSRAKTVFISDLDTPCLLLNEAQMNCNINSLHSRLASKTVTFRPHLKTTKAIEIARRMVTGAHGPATEPARAGQAILSACPAPEQSPTARVAGNGRHVLRGQGIRTGPSLLRQLQRNGTAECAQPAARRTFGRSIRGA